MRICYTLGVAALGLCFTLSAQAADKVCKLQILGNDLMQYDKNELKVDADCTQVQLTLTHTGKLPVQTMGHSWVLTKTPDMQAVLNAGQNAGVQNNYLPTADKRVLAATKLIGGGQTTSVTFSTSALQKGGDYTYFCSFPGHAALMKGKFSFG
jgi:azurin